LLKFKSACYDSLPGGDVPSSEEPAQSVESTLEQRTAITASDISDDGPKGGVMDMVRE